MKRAWITLQLDHGSGQKKDWYSIEISTVDHEHLNVWDSVRTFIKKIQDYKK